MKKILLILGLILTLTTVACGNGEGVEMPGKEQFDNGSDGSESESDSSDENQGSNTGENTDEGQSDSNTGSTGDTNDDQTDDSTDNEGNTGNDQSEEQSSDSNGSEDEGELSASEYDENNYSDLINPEDFDETDYLSDLVFIKPDGDLWRVVDNQGNVFRVSTSYDGLASGIICHDASITTDSDGDKRLSLTRDYELNGDIIIKEGDVNQIFDEFVVTFLNRYKNTSNMALKVMDYTIQETSIRRDVGKGAKVIEFIFTVTQGANDSEWESEKVYTASIVIYGYDNTWILPRYNHPFGNDNLSLGEVVDDDNTANDQEDADSDDEEPSVDDITTSVYEDSQYIIYTNEIPLTGDDNEYRTELFLFNKESGSNEKVYDGLKNGSFNFHSIKGTYVYFTTIGFVPNSETFPEVYIMVDLADKTSEVIINEGLIHGVFDGDIAYMFSANYLYEIDLVTASKLIVCRLPMNVSLTYDEISVLAITDEDLTIQIASTDFEKQYSINRNSGMITELE